jgi:hypothetical protein
MNRILNFVLACMFALVFSDSASSMYDPHIGKFCSKNPIGYSIAKSPYSKCFPVTAPVQQQGTWLESELWCFLTRDGELDRDEYPKLCTLYCDYNCFTRLRWGQGGPNGPIAWGPWIWKKAKTNSIEREFIVHPDYCGSCGEIIEPPLKCDPLFRFPAAAPIYIPNAILA